MERSLGFRPVFAAVSSALPVMWMFSFATVAGSVRRSPCLPTVLSTRRVVKNLLAPSYQSCLRLHDRAFVSTSNYSGAASNNGPAPAAPHEKNPPERGKKRIKSPFNHYKFIIDIFGNDPVFISLAGIQFVIFGGRSAHFGAGNGCCFVVLL